MKLRIILILLLAVCLSFFSNPIHVFAWDSKVHKEVARDAWYFMEHSSYATQRQKDAINWIYQAFQQVANPWEIVASGTTWPDKVEHVCFKGITHKKSFWGHNFNSWYHFLDMYSRNHIYSHSEHPNCNNFGFDGEHNYLDGYNYRRHEELIASYNTDDIDSWAAWWIDDDNFCLQHASDGLELYEKKQGGKGKNGLLIGSTNSHCYTQWDDDNPKSDFWNIIFAPIDNLGRSYYQMAITHKPLGIQSPTAFIRYFFQYQSLYYLGAALHAADASVFHHVLNSTDHGHSELESWAHNWYDDQKWFKDKYNKIKWYINSYYQMNGVDPIDRPFRWLVHRLASVVYEQESVNQVWERYTDEKDYDSKYWDYCLKAYPATVAFAIIVIEKFYLDKIEVAEQQLSGHVLAENFSSSTNPPIKVRVIKYHLEDMTNPEIGDDDVYGIFNVNDGKNAEKHRIPSSGDFGMDEGDTKTLNEIVFHQNQVGNSLKISAEIWEADWSSSDDIIGKGTLTFSPNQNWGKGGTYIIKCKYPYEDGHLNVHVKIE